MTRPTDRRRVLAIAVAAAVAASANPGSAQPTEIRGAVIFEQGAQIPAGRLEISVEDPAVDDASRRVVARTDVESGGGMRSIDFALSPPATASRGLRVVARLERADGWLLARGSAPVTEDAPVTVTLNTVMY